MIYRPSNIYFPVPQIGILGYYCGEFEIRAVGIKIVKILYQCSTFCILPAILVIIYIIIIDARYMHAILIAS